MKRTTEENKKLIDEMPFLMPKNRFTGKTCDEYDYSYTELDMAEIPTGWDKLFYDFCKEISPIVDTAYRFMQIKEKWGELRIYAHGDLKYGFKTIDYESVLDKYIEASRHTCCMCGSDNAKMTYTSYVIPYCKDCWDNNKYKRLSWEEVIEEDE